MLRIQLHDTDHQRAEEYFRELCEIARIVGKYQAVAGECLANPELQAMIDDVSAALPGGDRDD